MARRGTEMIILIKGITHSVKTNKMIQMSINYKNPVFITLEENSETIYEKGFKGTVLRGVLNIDITKELEYYDSIFLDNIVMLGLTEKFINDIHKWTGADVVYSQQMARDKYIDVVKTLGKEDLLSC